MKNDKIFKLNVIYTGLIILSVMFLFLPWSRELATENLGVEIVYLIPLFIIALCFLASSSILYLNYHIYSTHRVVYMVGFGLGLTGNVFSAISGTFGIYFSYVALRTQGVLLLGSGFYWLLAALLLIFCIIIFVNNRRDLSENVPVTDL